MGKLRISIKSLKVTCASLADFALVSYLCIPIIRTVFENIGLHAISYGMSFVITYSPVLILLLSGKIESRPALEFIGLFTVLILLLGITLCVHPDYYYWYARDVYGVFPYIFRLDNGIYIYLFLRLVNDPERILNDLRVSGWIMYILFAWQLAISLARGFWIVESASGTDIHISYSLDFGYNVIFFVLPFLHGAFKQRRMTDIIASIIGIIFCLIGGSRGWVLCVGVFIILYLFINLQKSKRLYLYTILIVLFSTILYFFYRPILTGVAYVLDKSGLPSRFIYMLLSGDVAESTGRDQIWGAAIQMIKEKPLLGYGAMGARPIISKLHYVGYPHQLFLELMIEYGVIFGGALSLFFVFSSIHILLMKDIGEWKFIFLIFFSNALELMLSYTYWHKQALWSALAIGVCIVKYKKRQTRILKLSRSE